jgi:hypothetical protein
MCVCVCVCVYEIEIWVQIYTQIQISHFIYIFKQIHTYYIDIYFYTMYMKKSVIKR